MSSTADEPIIYTCNVSLLFPLLAARRLFTSLLYAGRAFISVASDSAILFARATGARIAPAEPITRTEEVI